MAATLQDIAKRVGVTTATVSKVLNASPSAYTISTRTRQRVLDVARELSYRPSYHARALAKGRTFAIGLVCGGLDQPYFGELATRFMAEAEACGYHLILQVTPWTTSDSDIEGLESLMSRGVDGVVFIGNGVEPGTRLHEHFVSERFPFVRLQAPSPGLSSVSSDWRPGMDEAVRHLASRGHRRVGYVGYRDSGSGIDRKHAAMVEAAERHGVRLLTYACSGRPDDTVAAIGALLAEPDRPSAAVFSSDYTALGALQELDRRGIGVPSDLAVVGVDGTRIGGFFRPALTSVAQDIAQLAARAVQTVINLIDGNAELGEDILVPTHLIVREST